MSELIGYHIYPHKEDMAEVEYSRLISQDTQNLLVIRLVNRGDKTVSGYRVQVLYREKDKTIHAIPLENGNLYLPNGESTQELTARLPSYVEDGEIEITSVLYADGSRNEAAVSVPFVSYGVLQAIEDERMGFSESDGSREESVSNSKSRQPVTFMMISAFGVCLFLLLVWMQSSVYDLVKQLLPWDTYTMVTIITLLPLVVSSVFGLLAILNRKKNASLKVQNCLISAIIVIVSLFMFFSVTVQLGVICTLLLGTLFTVLSIIKKDRILALITGLGGVLLPLALMICSYLFSL